MDSRKEQLRNWYACVWENGQTDLVDEMMAPNARINGLEEDTLIGPEDFKRFQTMLLSFVRDVKVALPVMIVDGDWVAATLLIDGVIRKGGQSFRTSGQIILRFEDDLIIEAYNQVNLFPFFEGAGLLPERTVDHCLMGIRPRFDADVATPQDLIGGAGAY
ncbi:MAG: nuclear transport factor 2 family protein [Pseudomonadota bacterium]